MKQKDGFSSVDYQKTNRIAIISINRPHARNAVDGPCARELAEAFQLFEDDPECDVAILRGEGEHFCAGADLKAVANPELNTAHILSPQGNGPMGPSRMLLNKPVIAAVEGYCVAGGLELAVWCDLRVASTSAIFGVFCRRFGVPLIDGGTVRLPRLIGASRAADMILTGRAVPADEAFSFGLVNRLAAPGQALQLALELAQQIASHPSTCMRSDRLSSIEQWSMNLQDAIAHEFSYGMKVLASGETFKGAGDFVAGKGRHGEFKNG